MQETVAAPPARAGLVPAGLIYTLRILVTAHTVALLVAASFAGRGLVYDDNFALTLDPSRFETHVMAGLAAHVIGLLQLIAAILVWRPGRGAGWPALASLGLFVLGVAQHFLLMIGLNAHLPNGVALFGLLLATTIWVWSPRAAQRR
ncbi:hypothetical protein OIE66_20020 [Nonomuraea sp. NBC_01738]|uniref:hypothetical protein n=1 Tax=Nonomuraea sp. NBC_01738 TaxID=2976003 RepID=UPI002E1374BD|nr:hypothetical protein OIE66_20020 [Nonomuraea sp. NBC_01738]